MKSIATIVTYLVGCIFIIYYPLQCCAQTASFTYADPSFVVSNLPTNIFGTSQISIQYHQFVVGPNYFNNSQGYMLNAKIAIPNGPIDGCSPYPSKTRAGDDWNNTIVFVFRTNCAAFIKVKTAEVSGVLGLVNVNCSPGPPTYCAKGRQNLSGLVATYGSLANSVKLAGSLIGYNDGYPIIQALLANPQLNLTISMPATGPLIDPTGDIRKALVSLAKAVPTPNADLMVGALSTQAWANTTLDPCTIINKPFQFMCVAGKFIRYDTGARFLKGSIPVEINYLKDLENFSLNRADISGSIPDMSNCTALTSFDIVSNAKITSMFNSISSLSKLVVFAVSSCSLKSIPVDIGQLLNLEVFLVSRNMLTTLPTLFSKSLFWIDVSYNNIVAPLQNFSGNYQLFSINLAYNQFYSTNSTNLFDNLPKLNNINLASNNITGPVPLFSGAYDIQIIMLDNNKFTGGLPSTWNIPMHCSNNNSILCSNDCDCGPNQRCQSLLQVSVSRNLLTGSFNFISTSLTDLDLSFNFIDPMSDQWGAQKLVSFSQMFNNLIPQTIVNFNMQNNLLRGDWGGAAYAGRQNNLQTLNFAYNQITTLPPDLWGLDGVPGPFRIFDCSYNNLTGVIPTPLQKPSIEKVVLAGNPGLDSGTATYPAWISTSLPIIKIPGTPYVCPTLKANGGLQFVLEVSPKYFKFAECSCDRGYYGSAPACLDIPSAVSLTNTNTTFTDSTFGSNRLMTGVDISWILNGGTIDTPARAFLVYVNIIRSNFNEFTDVLEIYEGDQALTGQRVFSIRGTDAPVPTETFPDFAPNAIVVLNSKATLVFRSKKLSGVHFSANYSVSAICPSNYVFFEQSQKCEKLFALNQAIQIAIFCIISAFILLLVAITTVITIKRNSLIIRSSSFPFCLSMLIFMIALGIGSYFYAVYPEAKTFVCHIRPWLTAGPLVGILSALLVKVDRIRRIFSSKELVVQTITNAQLAQTMGMMLCVEFAILIWFSGSSMSESVQALGKGATNQLLVSVCTSTDSKNGNTAFNAWLAVQFIYIAAFLLVAVVIAWSVRKVPSAFNEAPSIASSLMSLAVLLIILIPLNYMVDDNPNALMLIRGLGQILATSVLALFFFGPKLYLILEGKDNDKTLSSLGSSRSSSSSSEGSSKSAASTNEQTYLLLMNAIKRFFENYVSGSKDTSDLSNARQNFSSNNQSSIATQIASLVHEMETFINKNA